MDNSQHFLSSKFNNFLKFNNYLISARYFKSMRGGELLGRGEPLEREAFVASMIGASGVGKSTLAKLLQLAGVAEFTPTVSDRPLRPIELDDPPVDRIFRSPAAFDRLEKAGKFLTTKPRYRARYAVLYIKKPPAGKIPMMVLKPWLIYDVRAYYPNLQVYHIETRGSLLPGRMRKRGQLQEDIDNRMWEHGAEVIESRQLADHSIDNNGPIEETLRQLRRQLIADYTAFQIMAGNVSPAGDNATMEPYDATESFA